MATYRFTYWTKHDYRLVLEAETLEEAKELFNSEEYYAMGYEPRDLGGRIYHVEVEEIDA